MDFIGRFENLNKDFRAVCCNIGIEDYTLPKLHISGNRPYTDLYTDELKDIVYKLYKREINYFGFEYGE